VKRRKREEGREGETLTKKKKEGVDISFRNYLWKLATRLGNKGQ